MTRCSRSLRSMARPFTTPPTCTWRCRNDYDLPAWTASLFEQLKKPASNSSSPELRNPPLIRRDQLVAHDAGDRAHAAVPAVAVRAVPRRAFSALHFALVEGDQGAFVVFNRTGILTNIAGVVNTAGQFAEIALSNGCEGAYADLGGFSDLLERDAPIAANRGQTKDVFFLYHLPASPGINL